MTQVEENIDINQEDTNSSNMDSKMDESSNKKDSQFETEYNKSKNDTLTKKGLTMKTRKSQRASMRVRNQTKSS